MPQVVNFKNSFGALKISFVTDFMPVGEISQNMPEVSSNLFDVETAEKIALITDNKNVQIGMCYPLNGQAYLIYHSSASVAAVCKIESISFPCAVSPAEQIALMARSNAQWQ